MSPAACMHSCMPVAPSGAVSSVPGKATADPPFRFKKGTLVMLHRSQTSKR